MDREKQMSIIPIAVFLILVPHAPLAAPNILVGNICKGVQEMMSNSYSDCVQAIMSDRRTETAADYLALANIAFEIAITNTTHSHAQLLNMLKNQLHKSMHEESSRVRLCFSIYKSSVEDFKASLRHLDEDPRSSNYEAAVTGVAANSCEDAMAECKVKIPAILLLNYCLNIYSVMGYKVTEPFH